MRIAIMYGGRTTEHEVSLLSAAGVLRAIAPRADGELELIGVARDGVWYHQDLDTQLQRAETEGALAIEAQPERRVVVLPADGFAIRDGARLRVDCVVPLIHGSFGEDGSLQGLLEHAGIPYVGSGLVGSAVGMDKLRAKQIWESLGLPVVPYLTVTVDPAAVNEEQTRALAAHIDRELGFPVFVKPNAAGSSVGITRVSAPETLEAAVRRAAAVDASVLIEQALAVREIETAVLGNESATAFDPGEVVPSHEFYDYDAKYTDPEGARLVIPAEIDTELLRQARELALAAFRALDCAGLARVDLFLTREGRLYLNEINTIPGFTPISMYPKMVEAAGIPYPELIARLVDLAIERHARRERRDFSAR